MTATQTMALQRLRFSLAFFRGTFLPSGLQSLQNLFEILS
uniref:Uncharacterized protein n=1 Tax=Anguilla anguilla TaxID=7936 RepID=A0A0E9VH06_ANGAN